MAEPTNAPKIHIDTDWKAEAQKEKQRLAEQSKAAEIRGAGPGGPSLPGGLPPANFESLLNTLVTQALFALGAIPDPVTGQRVQHLDLARHHIDMIGVLEQKTKGNLTEDEASMLASAAYKLRSRYIQMAQLAR